MKQKKSFYSDYNAFYKKKTCIACGKYITTVIKKSFESLFDDYSETNKIHICQNCGLGYTYPFLTEKQLGKYYGEYEPHTHDDDLKEHKPFFYSIFTTVDFAGFKKCLTSNKIWFKKALTSFYAQRFFQSFPLHTTIGNKKLEVLDIGCGGGYFLLMAKKMGCEVYATEFNTALVKKLKKKGIYAEMSLDTFIKKKKKFDIIRLSQVIEHVDKPDDYLKKIHVLLEKNGELILGMPNFNTPARLFGKYFFTHLPLHRHHFTKKSSNLLLEKHGFTPLFIKTKSSGIFTISLLRIFHKSSSVYTIPLKLLEILTLSMILDLFKIGDGLEVYATKK